MTDQTGLTGSCACGAVRISALGAPLRVGLCHCMTCRKAHASAFNPFVVFAPSQVTIEGDVAGWSSSPGYVRYFCPRCGSRVFAENAGADETREYEVSLGSFDEAGVFAPQYESWIRHREPWLEPLWAPQFEAGRQGD